jgi:hypothetical protein
VAAPSAPHFPSAADINSSVIYSQRSFCWSVEGKARMRARASASVLIWRPSCKAIGAFSLRPHGMWKDTGAGDRSFKPIRPDRGTALADSFATRQVSTVCFP